MALIQPHMYKFNDDAVRTLNVKQENAASTLKYDNHQHFAEKSLFVTHGNEFAYTLRKQKNNMQNNKAMLHMLLCIG